MLISRKVTLTVFTLVAVAVIVCGGLLAYSRMGPTHSGAVTYEPASGRPAIVCLGDSLTAGDGAPFDQSYPAWLQRKLDQANYNYQVVNAGHSGDRVADGIARMEADVLRFHPLVVIVELGSNDPGHTPADTWQSQLDSIVAQMRARHIAVILGGVDEPGMAERYQAVGRHYQVPVVWFTSQLWSRPGLWTNAHHPNGAGYEVVMESFWPAVVQAIKQPR